MRNWHLGQRGRAAARGDSVCVCGSGKDTPRLDQAGVLPNSLSPMGTDGWAVIATVGRTGSGPLVNFAHFSKFDGTKYADLFLFWMPRRICPARLLH